VLQKFCTKKADRSLTVSPSIAIIIIQKLPYSHGRLPAVGSARTTPEINAGSEDRFNLKERFSCKFPAEAGGEQERLTDGSTSACSW
jgi:hypothetical protein